MKESRSRPHYAGLVRLALVGAVVATLCDAAHVHTSTLRYPHPFVRGQAAFAFPGFVGAFALMGLAYLWLAKALPAAVSRGFVVEAGEPRELVESMATFAFVYVLSAFGHREPLLLAALFYAAALVRIGVARDRAFMGVLAIVLAIMGTVVEGAMTQVGLVRYREPEVLGVPFWLGGLYMHGAFALRDGMRCFVYRAA